MLRVGQPALLCMGVSVRLLFARRYAWTYVETFQGVKKGDRVWQLAFGSGFKCCSAVWVALKKNDEKHDAWMDGASYT